MSNDDWLNNYQSTVDDDVDDIFQQVNTEVVTTPVPQELISEKSDLIDEVSSQEDNPEPLNQQINSKEQLDHLIQQVTHPDLHIGIYNPLTLEVTSELKLPFIGKGGTSVVGSVEVGTLPGVKIPAVLKAAKDAHKIDLIELEASTTARVNTITTGYSNSVMEISPVQLAIPAPDEGNYKAHAHVNTISVKYLGENLPIVKRFPVLALLLEKLDNYIPLSQMIIEELNDVFLVARGILEFHKRLAELPEDIRVIHTDLAGGNILGNIIRDEFNLVRFKVIDWGAAPVFKFDKITGTWNAITHAIGATASVAHPMLFKMQDGRYLVYEEVLEASLRSIFSLVFAKTFGVSHIGFLDHIIDPTITYAEFPKGQIIMGTTLFDPELQGDLLSKHGANIAHPQLGLEMSNVWDWINFPEILRDIFLGHIQSPLIDLHPFRAADIFAILTETMNLNKSGLAPLPPSIEEFFSILKTRGIFDSDVFDSFIESGMDIRKGREWFWENIHFILTTHRNLPKPKTPSQALRAIARMSLASIKTFDQLEIELTQLDERFPAGVPKYREFVHEVKPKNPESATTIKAPYPEKIGRIAQTIFQVTDSTAVDGTFISSVAEIMARLKGNLTIETLYNELVYYFKDQYTPEELEKIAYNLIETDVLETVQG